MVPVNAVEWCGWSIASLRPSLEQGEWNLSPLKSVRKKRDLKTLRSLAHKKKIKDYNGQNPKLSNPIEYWIVGIYHNHMLKQY